MMEDEKKRILHELYVFSEWKPEPDFIQNTDGLLPWKFDSVLKWIPFMGSQKSMLDNISFYKEHHQRWQIALSDEGKVIAVLTDNILEIRTKRSDYSTIAARTTVERDANPQWRRIEWSPDCSFLVLAYSSGYVSFYDLTASNISNIAADCSRPGGMECKGITHALSAIVFVPLRVKDNKWTWEVLLLTHDGKLRGYLVSQTNGAKLHHVFHIAGGVSSAVFCSAHNLLLTAGVPRALSKDSTSAMDFGISAWRILNDDPFYKLSVASDHLDTLIATDRIQYYMSFLSSKKTSIVVSMVISPDWSKVVCVHTDGEVTVWRLPLLRLLRRWRLADQPCHDLRSPLLSAAHTAHAAHTAPAHVHWWSNHEIILSRFSGALTICSVEDMVNILGKNIEFLQGTPQVTEAYDNTFLALECESRVVSANQLRNIDASEQAVDSEEELGSSVVEATKELLKSVLYAITDIEHFQPKPKRITVVSRIYRLLGIKSTTPMDLFLRKIEGGKYEEALKLADSFQLDSDLVYQQQWRKTPVSCNAIYNYLAKVSKKIWVVHQCVDRLPETMTAAEDLLNFGLQLTNSEILEEVNRKKNDNPIKNHDEIVLEDLNAHTSELLRCRHVMLFYAERLKLYASILKSEKSTYIRDEYHRLRSNSIVHTCIELAKEGRIAALSCLWHQISSVRMQLTVLEHVPETIDPHHYAHLLPTQPVLTDKQLTDRVTTHNRDWCRKDIFRSIWNSNWSEEGSGESESGEGEVLRMCDVSAWYERRARQVEESSGLASHALALLTLAQARRVPDLQPLAFHLLTLDVLLYEVHCEDITLATVQLLTTLETCSYLMSNSTPDTFVQDLKAYVVPFLKRSEAFTERNETSVNALCNFLESLSENDLSPVLLVLKSPSEFELDVRTHLELAERCLLAHKTTEQLDKACDVLGTILKESDGSISPSELLRRLNELEKLINACNTLSCHDVNMTLSELKEMQRDSKKIQMLLTKLARSMSSRSEEAQQQDWEMLLSDILELHEIFFDCINEELCYEIYASALLTSGKEATIKLAAGVMACDAAPARRGGARRVTHRRAADLVLAAAEEYFNSASCLDDPSLQLARACLNLIKNDNSKIKAEIDLISALNILQDFKLSVLPIQVRLCEDRMSLIEECLSLDANAYKSSHKLLNLAKLLRVAGDDDNKREGLVLQRVAESGVRAGAGAAGVAEAARRLAALRYAPAAALLAHVATLPHLDRDLRRLAIDAALAHAHPNAIEDILRARLSLELEAVESELGARAPLAAHLAAHSVDDDYADAVQTPVVESKGLFGPVVEESMMTLSNHFVEQIWKNKLSFGWLEKSTSQDVKEEEKAQCYAAHCHEFYAALYPECAVSDSYYRYERFAAPAPALHAHLSLLKCFYMSDCLEMTPAQALESQVMQKCSEESTYRDTALSVACALRAGAAADALAAPPRAHTAAVCFALYALLVQCNEYTLRDQVFLTAPLQLGRLTVSGEEAPPVSEAQAARLVSGLARLRAAAECAELRRLRLAVDAQLFCNDADYRAETLYRLARSPEREHIEYACALAGKYGVSELQVWAQHAAALVLRARTAAAGEQAARLAHEPMLRALRLDTPAALRSIKEEIWDQVQGNEHAALISYFTLLKNVDERTLHEGLSPAEHVKLLKKVKAASPDLDYKLILSGPTVEEFTQHLLRILRPENVGLVTKLLRTLPPALQLPLSVNSIYTLWLTDHFFTAGSSATSGKWMQQYRQCASYFNKLSKQDLLGFIRSTCFTSKAIERVPAGTRSLMIMQAADYCQQEHENDFKSATKIEPSWSEVGQELMRWARFLDNYYSSTVQSIIEKDDPNNKEIWIEVERSAGDAAAARAPLAELLLAGGLQPRAFTALLQCLHVNLTLHQLYQHILDTPTNDITKMQKLVCSILSYDKCNMKVSEELLELVLSRAADLRLPPHLHISLLSLSQKKQMSNDLDVSKIVQFSLELLKNEWSDIEIQTLTEQDLQTEEGRKEVLLKCMNKANSWQKKKTLVDVIGCWPDFTPSSSSSSACYQLTEWLLSDIDNQTENCVLLKLLMRRPVLSEEEIKLLAENAAAGAIVNVLWIILLSKSQTLNEIIPNLLQEEKHANQSIDLSDELIKELLDNGMFTKLVGTVAYTPILYYMMKMEEEPERSEDEREYAVGWAVRELRGAGFLAEAGQLLLLQLRAPASLRGFSQTVLCHKALPNKHFK